MSDAHRRFEEWLAAGAANEPPRDAALHASVCEGCLASIAALDALTAIDPGRAALPASRTVPGRARKPLPDPELRQT